MAEATQSRIDIAAPPARVMAVVADLEDYPAWNEEVTKVEVLRRDGAGRPEHVRFVLDAGTIRDDYVLAYEWDGERSVRWRLVEGQMLTVMDGSYELAPTPSGTSVTYRLTVDIRIPMIGMLKRKAEKVVVDRALKGLKKRAEA